MEEGKHPLLKRRIHVDQYIAATDEIKLGEGRILAHVMPGKHAQVTNLLSDLVVIPHFHKEALQTLRRDSGHGGFRVCAGPRTFDGRRTDVGAENLDSGPGARFSRNSRSTIAIEYASSPVEHPGTHMRRASPCGRFAMSFGRTFRCSATNASGSRKKLVT